MTKYTDIQNKVYNDICNKWGMNEAKKVFINFWMSEVSSYHKSTKSYLKELHELISKKYSDVNKIFIAGFDYFNILLTNLGIETNIINMYLSVDKESIKELLTILENFMKEQNKKEVGDNPQLTVNDFKIEFLDTQQKEVRIVTPWGRNYITTEKALGDQIELMIRTMLAHGNPNIREE